MLEEGAGTCMSRDHPPRSLTTLFSVSEDRWRDMHVSAGFAGVCMNEIEKPSEAMEQALELGILVGQRQAFSAVAGRCTAAQVDAMRRMRDGKLYLHFAPNWASTARSF